MSKKKMALIGGGVLLVFLIILGVTKYAVGKGGEEAKISTLTVESLPPTVFQGTVEARQKKSYMVNPALGEVQDIFVKDGDVVKKGDALFSYYSKDRDEMAKELNRQQARLQKQFNRTQSDINEKAARLNRVNSLIEEKRLLEPQPTLGGGPAETMPNPGNGVPSLPKEDDSKKSLMELQSLQAQLRAEIEGLDTQKEQLQNELEEMNIKLSNAQEGVTVDETASFDGVVILNTEGRYEMQTPLVELVDEKVQVRSSVTEYDYNKLQVGQSVFVQENSSDREVKGVITKIAMLPETVMGQESSQFPFFVTPEENIHYGFRVQVLLKESDIYIPEEYTFEKEGQTMVAVFEDGYAYLRQIKGEKEDGQFKVQEGLQMDEKILPEPESYSDGQAVNAK